MIKIVIILEEIYEMIVITFQKRKFLLENDLPKKEGASRTNFFQEKKEKNLKISFFGKPS